jgi:hypothetical protein
VPLTEEQVLEVIILEIGDVDPITGDSPPAVPASGVLEALVPVLWTKYYAKDGIAPGLRELYTRRDALRRVMAIGMQKWFDTADNLSGLSIRGSQIYKHYQDMYDCSKAEIKAVEEALGKSFAPAIGVMGRTYCPPPFSPGGLPHRLYNSCPTCGLATACVCGVYP